MIRPSWGAQDAVIVTVKAPSLPAVAVGIPPLLGPAMLVAFIGNGIPGGTSSRTAGRSTASGCRCSIPAMRCGTRWRRERVIGGVAWPASSVPAPGVVRLQSGATRGTVLGTPDGVETAGLTLLAQAFRAASLPVTLADAATFAT